MTLLKRYAPPFDACDAHTSLPYTSTVAMTTIRVESEVRDRLAARAHAHGRSLGGELSAMLDDLMWQGIEDGYRRLAANEAEFTAYRDETAQWTGADLGGLATTAAEEYPEYNS
jgi:Arc-like DNA binding dprotein